MASFFSQLQRTFTPASRKEQLTDMLSKETLLKAYRLMMTARAMAETYDANRQICKYVHSTSRGHEAIQLATGLLLMSLFGWASVKTGWALRVAILLAGYMAMLALFARRDVFYWGLVPAPLAYVGLAFLPKALSDLAEAVRRTPYRAA